MVISVLFFGDLGRIWQIIRSKFSWLALYRVGVHGRFSLYLFILSNSDLHAFLKMSSAIRATWQWQRHLRAMVTRAHRLSLHEVWNGWIIRQLWNHWRHHCTYIDSHTSLNQSWFIAFHKRVSARWCPWNHRAWFTPPDHQRNVQGSFSYVGWRITHAHSQRQKEGQSNSGWYRPPVSFLLSSAATDKWTLSMFSIAIAPPFAGLRRFPEGRGFKQWTGDDSKALMKVSGSPFQPNNSNSCSYLLALSACLAGSPPRKCHTNIPGLSWVLLYRTPWSYHWRRLGWTTGRNIAFSFILRGFWTNTWRKRILLT